MSIRKFATTMRREESGAAMVIALLFATIMIAFIASMTAVAVRSSKNTAATKDSVLFAQAADAAIASAILLGNETGKAVKEDGETTLLEYTRENINTADYSTPTGKAKSSWYVLDLGNNKYVLYAAGYRELIDNPDPNASENEKKILGPEAVVLKVGLDALNMSDRYVTEDGTLGVRAASLERIAAEGFFASERITIAARGARFKTYSELNPQQFSDNPAGVSTNGPIQFKFSPGPAPDPLPIGKAKFYGSKGLDESNIGERCYGDDPNDGRCYTERKEAPYSDPFLISDKLDIPPECKALLENVDQFSDDGTFYRTYRENAVLSPNVPGKDILCLGGLNIMDGAKVTLPGIYDAEHPLKVYIAETLEMAPGTQLSPLTPLSSPSSLYVFGPGITKFDPGKLAGTGNINITANIIFPKADCTLGKGENNVTYRGSLACKSLTLNSDGTILYTDPSRGDDFEKNYKGNFYAWSSTSYENVDYEEAKQRFLFVE